MKNYKEMADSALKRISQYEAKQKKKKQIIKQTAIAVGSICIVLFVAASVFKENIFKIRVADNTKTTESIVEDMSDDKATSDSKDKTHKKTTKKSKDKTTKKQSISQKGTTQMSEEPIPSTGFPMDPTFIMVEDTEGDEIVYANYDLKGSFDSVKPIAKGSTVVTQELLNSINDKGYERTYAVMVNFEYSLSNNYLDEIKIDGITASELKNQADKLLTDGKDEDAKRLYVKINDAKRAYLRDYIDNFEETFSKNGMDIYVEERGTTIENMIFYTYATGDQINNFTCKSTEAFCFTLATKFK